MKDPWEGKIIPEVDEATLVCRVGDRLIVRLTDATRGAVGTTVIEGSIYEVIGRVYYGWDLRLEHGDGPPEVRVLNSQLLSYFQPAE